MCEGHELADFCQAWLKLGEIGVQFFRREGFAVSSQESREQVSVVEPADCPEGRGIGQDVVEDVNCQGDRPGGRGAFRAKRDGQFAFIEAWQGAAGDRQVHPHREAFVGGESIGLPARRGGDGHERIVIACGGGRFVGESQEPRGERADRNGQHAIPRED